MSGLGRFDKNYRNLVWLDAFGFNADAAVTTVAFTKEGYGLTSVTWNPSVGRACRLTGGAMSAICGADTVPGDWDVDFYLNESLTVLATASFRCTTSMTADALEWDDEIILQPGDRWFIAANGPQKATVILRATLEFEVL